MQEHTQKKKTSFSWFGGKFREKHNKLILEAYVLYELQCENGKVIDELLTRSNHISSSVFNYLY